MEYNTIEVKWSKPHLKSHLVETTIDKSLFGRIVNS